MVQFRNASFEFVKQKTKEELLDSARDPEAAEREAAAAADASRKAAFEFVKQLAAELSGNTFELPPFPDIALRVRDALNDPNVSTDAISRIVLSEPVLAARLLRMANSTLLRRGPIEVSDVKVAIGRLGFEVVRNAAVSLAMDNTFSAPAGSHLRVYIEATRKHSVHVAALSYIVARRHAKEIKPDEAMLAGLLHDIGRFYILTRINSYPDLFNHRDALEDLLRDWHTGVGRAIVESWGFAEPIAVAVDEHELLDRDHDGKADLADLVLVANLLAHHGDPKPPDQLPMSQIPALEKLKMDEEACITVTIESAEEVRSMVQALGG